MKECYHHGRHFGPSCPDCAIAIKELKMLRAKLDEVRAVLEQHHIWATVGDLAFSLAKIVGEP